MIPNKLASCGLGVLGEGLYIRAELLKGSRESRLSAIAPSTSSREPSAGESLALASGVWFAELPLPRGKGSGLDVTAGNSL